MKQENIQLFTPQEAMDILKIKDRRTLDSIMEAGELPYVKLSERIIRYKSTDIEALIEKNYSENIKY